MVLVRALLALKVALVLPVHHIHLLQHIKGLTWKCCIILKKVQQSLGREIVSGFLMPRPGTTNASEEKKSFSNTRKACN